MKSIRQTFFINEPPPPTGVAGVYITQIDVYFQKVSTQYGIELQIRTTENGVPTSSTLPFSSKTLDVYESYANGSPKIVASNDASLPTSFIFDTPVLVQSRQSYAFVLAPLGGNPDYNVWTAELSGTDVTTNSPIYSNNDSGDLFLSSNDIASIPLINEDIKYTISTANFTALNGESFFKPRDADVLNLSNLNGNFTTLERVFFSNNIFNNVILNVSNTSGPFNVGDLVYQGNSNSLVHGKIYASNNTVLKVSGANGAFSNVTLRNATSNTTANITSVLQNASVSNFSNVFSVPDTSVFSANQTIFIGTNNLSKVQIYKISSINSSNTLTLTSTVNFTDSSVVYGDILNSNFVANFASITDNKNNSYTVTLNELSVDSTNNITKAVGGLIIGQYSGASATFNSIVSFDYNSLTTNFSYLAPSNTNINWAFSGFQQNSSLSSDPDFIKILPSVPNEFTDITRSYLPRSLEFSKLPSNRQGNNSLVIKIDLSTSNNKISPSIDTIQKSLTITKNIIATENQISGSYLYPLGANYIPFAGETIYQKSYGNTSSGVVQSSNSSFICINQVNGMFLPNNYFYNSSNNFGFTSSVVNFGEYKDTVYYGGSRYISKSIILDTGQDSEDIAVYSACYRPASTNVFVYTKVINSHDNNFRNKSWTKLVERSSSALLSSAVDINDKVELSYGFDTSRIMFSNSSSTSANSFSINVPSTAGFANNRFIYLYSNDSANNFNVREIVYVQNSTSLTLSRPPSFTSSNAGIGIIPNIESTDSAFSFDLNNNIVRYVTSSDVVFDSFIQFAIKIVPVANTTSLIPKVYDLRCICTQI